MIFEHNKKKGIYLKFKIITKKIKHIIEYYLYLQT